MVIALHSTTYVHGSSTETAPDAILMLFSYGHLGVPVFFVISGFCIAASADRQSRSPTPAANFFFKRFRRIFPPYLALVAIVAPVVLVTEHWISPGLFHDRDHPIDDPSQLSPWQWLGNLTLTESWRHHLVGPPSNWFLGHAWTLAYEEQFYAVMGLFLVFFRNRIFTAAAILTLVEIPTKHLLWRINNNPADGFFFDGHWEHFAAGVLAYWITNVAQHFGVAAGWGMMICGLAYGSRALDETSLSSAVAWLVAIAISAAHRWDERIASLAPIAPLRWCGVMCYSLYLVHWPLCKAISHLSYDAGAVTAASTVSATIPMCLTASLAMGWLFHLTVERRFIGRPEPPIRRNGPQADPSPSARRA